MAIKIGTKQDDQIVGTDRPDIIIARDGDDVINAGAANDVIDGGKGDDEIHGDAGDDLVIAGKGDDLIDGGAGDDRIFAGQGDDVVVHVAADSHDGIDIYDGGADIDTLRLELTSEEWGREEIKSDVQAYLAFLAAAPHAGQTFFFHSLDLLVTRFESLEVVVDGQPLTVLVADPDGPPVVVNLSDATEDQRIEILGDGDTAITTGAGDDVIVVGNGTNVIDAGEGQNQITTGSGDDVVTAGNGGNVIDAGDGNNQITTGDGPDVIVVGSGDDIISSNGGDDHITIGDGDDIVHAGPGDDTIVAGEGGGDDVIDGFSGTDTVTYPSSTQDLSIDLRPTDRSATSAAGGGTVGDLLMNAGYDPHLAVGLAWGADIGTDVLISIENATGGAGNDTFIGSAADNTFDGAAGNDQVIYEGSVLGYDITIGAGISTVTDTDLANGDTGQDKLSAIEQAVFSDVTVMLDGSNNNPFTVPDTLSTTEDDAVIFASAVLLANDREFDGDGMTVTSLDTSGLLGTAVLNQYGSITYNPNGQFDYLALGESAEESFAYAIADGNGGLATGTVTVNITGVNDAPSGSPTAVLAVGTEDMPYTVVETDLLAGFSDAENDTLHVANLAASNGSVTDNGDGTYTITPTADFNGTVTLTYDVTDGNGGDLTGQTQTYTLDPVNDAPVLSGIDTSALHYTENDRATPVTFVRTASGDEFLVDSAGRHTTVAGLDGGGFVVTWDDESSDTFYGRIFDAAGQPVDDKFPIDGDASVTGSVAGLDGGGFVITWNADGNVYARIFDTEADHYAGNAFPITSVLSGYQGYSSVTALRDGGFVVTYEGGDGDIYGKIFDVTGQPIGSEFPIIQAHYSQRYPEVASLDSGEFVVAWRDFSPLAAGENGVRIFDASGQPLSDPRAIATYLYPDISVTGLDGGGFVATWSDKEPGSDDASEYSVRGQIFDAAAQPLGGEFLVNTTTYLSQYQPSVASLEGGGFMVAWEDTSKTSADYVQAIRGQIFDNSGRAVGGEFMVNTTTGYEYRPSVAELKGGGFVVAWYDSLYDHSTPSYAVRGQVFDAALASLIATDVDDTTIQSATVAIISGFAAGEDVLAFNTSTGSVSGSYDATHGILALTGSASLADYEAALRSVTYENLSDDPSTATRSLSFTVYDGKAYSDIVTRDISIARVNDAPVVVTNLGATVAENGTITIGADSLYGHDIDSDDATLTYTLTTLPKGGQLQLSAVALALGESFTQADLDNNVVTYVQDGSETLGDSFEFSLAEFGRGWGSSRDGDVRHLDQTSQRRADLCYRCGWHRVSGHPDRSSSR